MPSHGNTCPCPNMLTHDHTYVTTLVDEYEWHARNPNEAPATNEALAPSLEEWQAMNSADATMNTCPVPTAPPPHPSPLRRPSSGATHAHACPVVPTMPMRSCVDLTLPSSPTTPPPRPPPLRRFSSVVTSNVPTMPIRSYSSARMPMRAQPWSNVPSNVPTMPIRSYSSARMPMRAQPWPNVPIMDLTLPPSAPTAPPPRPPPLRRFSSVVTRNVPTMPIRAGDSAGRVLGRLPQSSEVHFTDRNACTTRMLELRRELAKKYNQKRKASAVLNEAPIRTAPLPDPTPSASRRVPYHIELLDPPLRKVHDDIDLSDLHVGSSSTCPVSPPPKKSKVTHDPHSASSWHVVQAPDGSNWLQNHPPRAGDSYSLPSDTDDSDASNDNMNSAFI